MPLLLLILSTLGADEPLPKPATRVVEGLVLDDRGKPVRAGRVLFSPQAPIHYDSGRTTSIDSDGRYRIELAELPWIKGPFPASGPLRYLAIVPGYRVEAGTVDAGAGPTRVDIRLTREPWKTTDIVLIDREGKAVSGARIDLRLLGGSIDSPRLTTDGEGHCRIEMAAGHSFGVTIQREGFLTTHFGLRNTDDDPSGFKITLREPIRGRVVDPQGNPVSGVRIGSYIGPNFSAGLEGFGDLLVRSPEGMDEPPTTDADGRFVLSPSIRLSSFRRTASGEFRQLPQDFCITDEGFRRLTFFGVDFEKPAPTIEVVLRPTRLVRIPIEHELAIPPGDFRLGWSLKPAPDFDHPEPWFSGFGRLLKLKDTAEDPKAGDRVEFHCPEGKFRLSVTVGNPMRPGSEAIERSESELTIPPGEGPLDLPTIRLTSPDQQRLVGKPAPEIEANDLDTGKPVRLADFRGRVVILDFWGYWCGPCITTMPEMTEVHRRFQDLPVTILAIHDQSIQSREEYDRKLAGVRHQLWNDRDLPFRVALDRPNPGLGENTIAEANGLTCKRYHIKYFPTIMVIDQGGKVAGTVHFRAHDQLEAMVKNLLAEGSGR